MEKKLKFYQFSGEGKGPQLQKALCYLLITSVFLWALNLMAADIPGNPDAANSLEAAGTILHIINTGFFVWGCRVFSGICVFSAGVALKNQQFPTAVVSLLGAILLALTPTFVKNLFSLSGSDTIFSFIDSLQVFGGFFA